MDDVVESPASCRSRTERPQDDGQIDLWERLAALYVSEELEEIRLSYEPDL